MSNNRTATMLQRVPVILAVTAHSYGLELQARGERREGGDHARKRSAGKHREIGKGSSRS
jgi:hypothetical protein